MNKYDVYLAGALFNEAEVSQRLKEGEILRKEIPNIKIFNPLVLLKQ